MLKVFGHINPDTDTVLSAMVWAWYCNAHTATKATPYRLGELNKETAFLLDFWKMPVPALLEEVGSDDTVTIVDTNNPEELPAGIHETTIAEILDHHKLIGGLKTKKPPTVTMRPYSATATVIYERIGAEAQKTMPKEIQGLVLSCIVSDTLAFRSPTTTPHDKALAEQLAKNTGTNIDSFSKKMFEAKSDVGDLSNEQLVLLDSKKFPVGDKTVRVSVIETAAPEMVLARKVDLQKALQAQTAKDAAYTTLLFIVDILREESTVVVSDEVSKLVYEKSFEISISEDTHLLPGVVSRKTQIVPVLKI